jgi:uncharacterized protein (TIGR02246 family)
MSSNSISALSEDVEALGGMPAHMIAAWAQNDGTAFAELFAEDGSMVLPGDVCLTNRDAIREFMTAAYAGPFKGTRVTGAPISVRFLSEGTGVLITRGGVLFGEETDVSPEREIQATWVLAKKDGGWCIAAYHNSPVITG